jgi:thiol-disulfide isomerase/thioredoxin
MQHNANKTYNRILVIIMVFVFTIIALIRVNEFLSGSTALQRKHVFSYFPDTIDLNNNFFYDKNNKQHFIKEYNGKYTVLMFLATWCKYCAKHFPLLDAVYPKLEMNNINIIPIFDHSDNKQDIAVFYQKLNINKLKPSTTNDTAMLEKLNVSSIPYYVVINEQGQAIGTMYPKWNSEDIINLFEELRYLAHK